MGTDDVHPKTINHLIAASVEKFANRPAVGFAFKKVLTYSQLAEKVNRLAALLKNDGIGKGDRVAILAENSPNWGAAYLAIVRIGAIAVPILPDFFESDVHHILTETKAKILFTTQRQIEKIYELSDNSIRQVITLDHYCCDGDILTVLPLKEYLTKSKDLPKKIFGEIERIAAATTEDDIASLIYTSGTSGHSKAVMLSHGNLTANVNSIFQICTIDQGWTFLSILPMSHAYEFTVGFLLPLACGSRIVYAEKTPTPKILEQICQAEHPNVICIVPVVMEKIYKKRILTKVQSSKLLKTAFRFPILRKRVFKKAGAKLLEFFGGELNLLCIGGAPLNNEVEKFLAVAGAFPYLVGYGLTETSPLLAAGPFKDKTIAIGSTGKPVPQVEIKIVNADKKTGIGEIYARGPNIMKGYYQNPELTAETIDKDGWLATGDLGFFDKYNNLHVKGRSKSVIVFSSGENIYPEVIEEKINSEVHVVESLVTDNNGQLEAWVYLDYDLIDSETAGKNQQKKLEHIEEILAGIKKTINLQLPNYSKITRVVEREEPFIKTATHKIKRYLYSKPH